MKYIHLGLCKTGTTFLQRIIFPYWMLQNDVQFINNFKPVEMKKYSQKVLISNEGFSGGTGIDKQIHLNCLNSTINLFGTNSKYILTIREEDSFVKSLYKEKIKNGYSGKFSEFRDSFNFTKTIDEIFDLLNNSIQKQNLLILEYEELKVDPVSFLQKIASFMEIAELTKDEIRNLFKSNINKSKSDFSFSLLQKFNKLKWNWGRKVLYRILP